MYYAVLRKEIKMPCSGGELTLKVGGVYLLRKRFGGTDDISYVQFCSVETTGWGEDAEVGATYGPWYNMSVEDARDVYFVRHFNDLDDAMEESFMVCEAAYC